MTEISATLVAGFIPTILIAILARLWSLHTKKKEDDASIRVAKIESATDILPGIMGRLILVEGLLDDAKNATYQYKNRLERSDRIITFITELTIILVRQNVDLLVEISNEGLDEAQKTLRCRNILSTAMKQAQRKTGHDGEGFSIEEFDL
jgi:hypothetical protein